MRLNQSFALGSSVILLAVLCSLPLRAADVISTYAGTGKPGYAGDGGPATAALVNGVAGIAFDGAGNIYISDIENHRIRKVDANGKIATIAGTGAPGFSGDGGPATQAQLKWPDSVAVDAAGNIYVAEDGNLRIRRIDTAGIITTVAGDGTIGPSGDGGPATAAGIGNPSQLIVDQAGNLYFIAEHHIRKVDAGGTISTFAGSNAQGFSGDGGPATQALFNNPEGLAVDKAGNVYVVDADNNRIRKIDVGGIITTIAGTGQPGYSGDGGPALNAMLGAPGEGLAIDAAGSLYFGDYGPNEEQPRLRKISAGGTISTVAGTGTIGYSGDGGLASAAKIGGVNCVAVAPSGDVYFGDNILEDNPAGGDEIIRSSRVRRVSVNNPDFVQNPETGMSVSVASRASGIIELAVNVDALSRATYDVATEFEDVPGRSATALGRAPSHDYDQSGLYIATSRATDTATGAESGKMRKTLAVSRNETGEAPLVSGAPSKTSIAKFTMKGKFLFNQGTPDVVTFTGTIELPAGMDLSQQQIAVGAGNITDTVALDPKGKAILPSACGRIIKLQVKFPKPASGTVTGPGQLAKLSFTMSLADMDLEGFDTEGISPAARVQDPAAKSYSRAIQVALAVAGVTYELKAPVVLKIANDVGQIQGRSKF